MFCKKCGKQISDGVQFCPNCGASQESSAKEETALKAAVFGLLCWCCCGVQLIAGAPAIYFGYLAIRNNEPEREKAYIAMGIGVLDMIGFLILMIAVIRSN